MVINSEYKNVSIELMPTSKVELNPLYTWLNMMDIIHWILEDHHKYIFVNICVSVMSRDGKKIDWYSLVFFF